MRYGGLAWVQAVFYAVGAAVIGIIAYSAYRLTKKSIGHARLLWAIYLIAAAVTVITESEEVAGAFVFGSGLAIVPFLYGGLVKEYGWLTDQQFLDAVAVALITPGPVVITTGFIGYLLAGLPGATVAAAATFLPAYILTIIPAPYFKKHGKRPGVAAFGTV